MPSDDVDEPAFRVQVEGNLWPGDPAGGSERGDERVNQGGVARAGIPLDLTRPGPQVQVQARLQHAGNASDHRDAELLEVTSLEAGDRPVADVGQDGDVDLTQPTSNPNDAQERAEPLVVHERQVDRARLAAAYAARVEAPEVAP